MATRGTLTDGAIYERRDLDNMDGAHSTITVTGDTVNIYHSIKEEANSSAPTATSEMQLDDSSPFAAGVYEIKQFDYIAVESTGTSTVKSRNVIK